MVDKDKLNLLATIKEYSHLNNLIRANVYTQDDYTNYLAISNKLAGVDIVSFLLELIRKADRMEVEGSFCKNELVNAVGWKMYVPCAEAAEEYRRLKDETTI